MKRLILFLMIALTKTAQFLACPTCVGSITEHAPVFFNEDLYRSPETINFEELEEVQNDTKKGVHHDQNK